MCVQSLEALYVCVYSHGGPIRLRFQSVEALYVGVSSQWRLYTCVQSLKALYVSVSSHWMFYTFVCRVCDGG